ncbi:MAG TPA: RNA polymerase sigma factor [Vicinamibacteria bacterium]|jgi:RNA polymerase sigma-70 factor (ECF subfamily)
MNDLAGSAVGHLVSEADSLDLAREFEQRLADSSALAFRVAYSVLRRREDAEDVAQEALSRAYRNLGRLRDRGRFRSWLVRISWRLALDHCRAGRRRDRREQVGADRPLAPTAEELAVASEFRERLWREIDALPEKLRIVLVLAGIEGYALREVAALLELPEGTVKSRIHLARKRLAERLK